MGCKPTTVYPMVQSLEVEVDPTVVEVCLEDKQQTVESTTQPTDISITVPDVVVYTIGIQGPPGAVEDGMPYDKEDDHVEISDTVDDFYYGTAAPGTAHSAPSWMISKRRITRNGSEYDRSEKFADGEGTFTKVWDDRLGYTY